MKTDQEKMKKNLSQEEGKGCGLKQRGKERGGKQTEGEGKIERKMGGETCL